MRADTLVLDPPQEASTRLVAAGHRGRRLRVLVAVSALASLASAWSGMYSWHYFVTGGQALLSQTARAGLHTYAYHPELQMGPLALLVAAPLTTAGFAVSAVLGAAAMTAVGVLVLLGATTLAREVTGRSLDRRWTVVAGAFFLPVWQVLAVHYGHLDDVLALGALVAALLALARRRPVLAALLLATATGAKPWAAPVAVLLVGVASPARRRAVTAYVVAVVVPWVPFVLADRRTLAVGRFTIAVADDSALRVLGVGAAATPPWDRPAQLVLGAVLVLLAVRRGRWLAAPLLVVAARVALDPGTYAYYAAGLAVGALILDAAHRRLPLLTLVVLGWVGVDLLVSPWAPTVGGILRLLVPAGLSVLALLGPRTSPRRNATRVRRHRGAITRPAAAAG